LLAPTLEEEILDVAIWEKKRREKEPKKEMKSKV
jgi:hypothetical protein